MSRKLVAKLGVAMVATLVALVIGELSIRLLRPAPEFKSIDLAQEDCVYQRSTNPLLGFELKANYRNADPDFIASYERTNAHGQRDKERSVQCTNDVLRVVVLGDSVVEGHGLAEDEIISRQWEDLYTDDSTEILNFGVSAYCTLAEIELLETKALPFDPDVVVVLFVENDFDNFNREAFSLGEASPKPVPVKWLFRRSHVFRLAAIRLNLFHFGAETDPVRWNKKAIGDNNVVEGFKRLKALADREGFQPLIAIWPRFLDNDIVDTPLVSDDDPTPLAERLASMHGLPSARLSILFERHRTQTEGVDNPRRYYSSGDGLHPSSRGAAVAAAGLKELLEELETGALVVGDAPTPEAQTSPIAIAQSLGKAEPDYSRVYHSQGVALLRDGKNAEAIEQFQRALVEDPGHAGANGNMGLAYKRLGKPDEAKRFFQRAIEFRDDFVQAHFNLARLLVEEGDSSTALPLFRRTIEIDPKHTDALNLLGMELGKARKFAEAQVYLERAVTIEPEFSEAHNNLGTVFAAKGELGKALRQFKEAVRTDPTNRGARARLKQVQSMLGKQRSSPDDATHSQNSGIGTPDDKPSP
ncbi:tetratricopeptide repeat protein [Verrucomicrobiales bacterium]|nr:tetratricopeptide repeat protein [Verrucomicrobiales bacterium]